MTEKSNINIGFEKEIWDAACELWGHIPAADYRKVIIGLIFLRYISCAFDKLHQKLVEEGYGFEEDKDHILLKMFSLFQKLHVGKSLQIPPIHRKLEL